MKNASKSGYKFITMKEPLKFPVSVGTKVVIPAGQRRVQIAFGQSSFVRNIETGAFYRKPFNATLNENEVRCNVYRKSWNSPIVHS